LQSKNFFNDPDILFQLVVQRVYQAKQSLDLIYKKIEDSVILFQNKQLNEINEDELYDNACLVAMEVIENGKFKDYITNSLLKQSVEIILSNYDFKIYESDKFDYFTHKHERGSVYYGGGKFNINIPKTINYKLDDTPFNIEEKIILLCHKYIGTTQKLDCRNDHKSSHYYDMCNKIFEYMKPEDFYNFASIGSNLLSYYSNKTFFFKGFKDIKQILKKLIDSKGKNLVELTDKDINKVFPDSLIEFLNKNNKDNQNIPPIKMNGENGLNHHEKVDINGLGSSSGNHDDFIN
jgi:hypothetical protein